MKESTFYKLLIAVLLLINVALVVFVLSRGPGPHGPPNGGNPNAEVLVPSQLQLDEEQVTAFKSLAKKHREEISTIGRRQSELLNTYLKTSPDQLESPETLSLLSTISSMESDKLKSTKAHFEDVRKLLNADQQTNFEPFMENSIGRILNQGQRKASK